MTEHFICARDGTQIFVDDRGPISTEVVPIICLPGLTRNSKDFEPVFEMLANTRRVIAVDLRGRGRSQYADSKTYNVAQELDDVIMVLDKSAIKRVALIGTSRGGIIGQVMAASHHDRVAGLLLNDIGPEINPVGLTRILNSIGTQTHYKNWGDAASQLAAQAQGFSNITPEHWLIVAKRILVERLNHPCTDYDPKLNEYGLSIADIEAGKLQSLWGLTPSLIDVPVAVLRGQGSDILSVETVEKMHAVLPHLLSKTIPDRGHVPFLDEPESISTIQHWLATVDQNEKSRREAGLSINPLQ